MKKITYALSLVSLFALQINTVKAQAVKPKENVSKTVGVSKITAPVFKKDVFNIVKFGAKKDGIILNTKAINDAIIACNKNGGGTVLVPEGLWLTGPIVLK